MPPEGYYERKKEEEAMSFRKYLEIFYPDLLSEEPKSAQIINFAEYKTTKGDK